jgi:hypothetical protein
VSIEIKNKKKIDEILENIRINKFYLEKYIELRNMAESRSIHVFDDYKDLIKSGCDDEINKLRIELCTLRGE